MNMNASDNEKAFRAELKALLDKWDVRVEREPEFEDYEGYMQLGNIVLTNHSDIYFEEDDLTGLSLDAAEWRKEPVKVEPPPNPYLVDPMAQGFDKFLAYQIEHTHSHTCKADWASIESALGHFKGVSKSLAAVTAEFANAYNYGMITSNDGVLFNRRLL